MLLLHGTSPPGNQTKLELNSLQVKLWYHMFSSLKVAQHMELSFLGFLE